jgi:hypothetical protein
VVLYGCETWSLILRKQRRLRVFENRVLRRIFGLKRMKRLEVGESCIMRRLIRMMRSRRMGGAGHVARMGKSGMHIGYGGKATRKETSRKNKT